MADSVVSWMVLLLICFAGGGALMRSYVKDKATKAKDIYISGGLNTEWKWK